MGMVSHKLLAIQSAHFHTAGKSYCATRWIAGLITQLLQVVHTQWIYRCILVHDRTTGVLISTHNADLLKEIEHQLSLGPDDLAKKDPFLLECNFDDITSTTGEAQGYWLLGIQTAREASRIRTEARAEAQSRPRKHQRRHKFYTVRIEQIQHMINSATQTLNNSHTRYELERREPSFCGSHCNAAVHLIACGV